MESRLALTGPDPGFEARDYQWLVETMTAPIVPTAENLQNLAYVDQASLLSVLDLNWLENGQDSGRGRTQATLLGQMAFAYHTPGTRWYRNADLLAQIRQGYEGFAEHQNDRGRFVWPAEGPFEVQMQEHSWRLEPLVLGYLWIEDALTDEERERYLAMLGRGAEYLIDPEALNDVPPDASNRGVIWASTAELSGLFLSDERFHDQVQALRASSVDAIHADGQPFELQGGIDGNYSFNTITYGYTYRLYSGDTAYDDRLLESLRWATRFSTPDGNLTASGASVRLPDAVGGVVLLQPALRAYSHEEPALGTFAVESRPLQGNMAFGVGGLTVNSLIWTMLAPEPTVGPADEAWYRSSTPVYVNPETIYAQGTSYALVRRDGYQTGVTFQGWVAPYNGLQMFAAAGEAPLVQHAGRSNAYHSSIMAGGVDSSQTYVSQGPSGAEAIVRSGEARADWGGVAATTLIERRGAQWTLYAATPRSFTVIAGDVSGGAVQAHWTMPNVAGLVFDADARTVTVPGRDGRLTYLAGTGQIVEAAAGVSALDVSVASGPAVFGFSDGFYRFDSFNSASGRLAFTDGSGSYVVSLAGILDGSGNLDRSGAFRLEVSTPDLPTALAIQPDQGMSNSDAVTNTSAVTLAGLVAEPGLTVHLFEVTAGADLGSVQPAGSGSAIPFAKTINLAEGAHRIRARAVDSDGFASADAFLDVVIDLTKPWSAVTSLNPRQTSLTFAVSAAGADPTSGGAPASVIASFDLYVSIDGAPFSFWKTVPASSPTVSFTGESNHTYAFYSLARDAAGNLETKPPGLETSTYVPDLDAPTTAVGSVASATSTFAVAWSGTDAGGSGLASFELFVQIDGGATISLGRFPARGVGGVYSDTTTYQTLADGVTHTYRFFTVGTDVAGNVEGSPTAPSDVTVSATFAAPSGLEITAFDVQKGATQRSFVRYLDLTFNRSDELQAIVASVNNDANPANDRIRLTRYDLNGTPASAVSVSLRNKVTTSDRSIVADFGAAGIGGNAGTTVGDGYYILEVDLDGNGTFDIDRRFYRLLGDVTGDGQVSATDIDAIAQALMSGSYAPEADVNGDGVVNAFDRTLATRSKGRALGSGLRIDD